MKTANLVSVLLITILGGIMLTLGRVTSSALGAEPTTAFKFSFGPGKAAPGYTQVLPTTVYTNGLGYGFEPGSNVTAVDRGGDEPLHGGFCTSDKPFLFSVAVPEGNYKVTVTLGESKGESMTTVKAEARRLMLERIHTGAGQFETRTFMVNVRTPKMPPGNALKLDTREWNPQTGESVTPTWDDKLTLQFSDDQPCVCAVEIEKVDDAITVFLLGDSTVTDQTREPYGTWGQMLPRWFKPPVAIANHAESGETLKAFRAQRRWDKVMSQMKPGDYVFMQFGHNDLNKTGHDGIWPREDTMGDWAYTHSDANTEYKWLLAANAVEVKRRGGIPVIVSPMTKINLRTGELNVAGLGDYPKAAVEAAQMAGAACIDLNAMSVELCTALGTNLDRSAYVDGLHTDTYGGYLLSRCIVEGIRQNKLDLARYIVDDTGTFDPKHPQPLPDDFKVPLELGGRGRGTPNPASTPTNAPSSTNTGNRGN
jgi:lysophospholipase L1-like esterase